jgi:hypothetical protein
VSLTNVEFVADMIELNDTGMEIIRQSLGGNPLQFVVPSYRNYAFNPTGLTASTTTQISMPIPAKFSSLKSIFVMIRDVGTGVAGSFPFSSVTLGNNMNYYFRVGSQILPPKAPYSVPEAFAELAKAMASIADINYLANVEMAYYSLNATVANTDTGFTGIGSGCFAIGLDCENYPNASKSDIFAGMNTNSSDIYFVYNITTLGAAAYINNAVPNPRFDSFALFDQIIIFENSTAYVKF